MSRDRMDELSDEIEEVAYDTIGAAIEVHRRLGPGFLENVYENAMSVELEKQSIPHRQQVPATVEYRGVDVGEGRVDLLVDDELVVELKVVDQFAPIHRAQLISYLEMTDRPLGLLLNFNTTKLKDGGIKRVFMAENR